LKTVEAGVVSSFPPTDAECFLDANTLYYSVVAYPDVSDYCSAIIRQISTGERQGATLSSAVADAIHKVMFTEIVEVHQRPRGGLLAWFKSHPEALQSLTKFSAAAEQFSTLPLAWLPTDSALMLEATAIGLPHGLTINDALIVAAMRRHGIQHLVTNDDDFRRVPGITVWMPR
jgi:predicted nucleic acid-binding protein